MPALVFNELRRWIGGKNCIILVFLFYSEYGRLLSTLTIASVSSTVPHLCFLSNRQVTSDNIDGKFVMLTSRGIDASGLRYRDPF